MASAAIIQRALLPDPRAFAADTRLDVHAAMIPARDVGGDFFDLVTLSDGRVALGVGDVCGKGVPAALYMGISKTLIRINLRERPDLAAAIRKANAYLTTHYPAEQFATLFYAAYDPATRRARICELRPSRRAASAAPTGASRALPAGGLPVGMFEDLRVTAAHGAARRRRPVADLQRRRHRGGGRRGLRVRRGRGLCEALAQEEGGAAAAVEAVIAAARAFAGCAPQSDDITCVALARADSLTAGRPRNRTSSGRSARCAR